jgi:hypothetical protein
MAEGGLRPFVGEDQFLRRVLLPDHLKRGIVRWRTFKDKDPRLSLTFRDEALCTDAGLDAYHHYFSESAGAVLPGILWFSFLGLTQRIAPALEPSHDPDSADPVYGHLHCSTERPRDKPHMELLAKLVNDGEYAGIAKRCPDPSTGAS